MMEYTDTNDPEAPQAGDVVVVVRTFSDLRGPVGGVTGFLLGVGEHPQSRKFCVRDTRGSWWVYSVRRPTEPELTAFRLAQGIP